MLMILQTETLALYQALNVESFLIGWWGFKYWNKKHFESSQYTFEQSIVVL